MGETAVPTITSPADVRRIEQICDRFEAAWKEGQRPALEAFLGEAASSFQSLLLRELLALDWEYRVRAGETPQAAEYEARFPTMAGEMETIGREVAVTTASDRVPRRLAQYQVVRQLGRGGMGVVYEAIHESLGRRVALKVLPAMNVADGTARERFRREAQMTARLHHPNIVQIFEVGEADGQPYLALEFVAGPSLADHWRHAPQPPRQAAALIETLARAVHFAHAAGVVHRDLKPGNVLLADSTPKITDFGLAHPLGEGDLTATGDIVGTPAYMAPEQAWGKRKRQEVGPAADIYALGAVLYEALTGRPVFQGVTPLDALEQVRNQEPIPPSRLLPQLPRDLETVCLKCLEKEPDRRYRSAEELADDLKRFLADEPIAAKRTGLLERWRRWCLRNPTLLAASILGGIAVLSATGLAVNAALTVELRREQHLTQSALQDATFQRTRAEQNAAHLVQQQELTEAALVDAKRFRHEAEQLSASLALERGLGHFEHGDIARGMLFLGRSLQMTPAGTSDLEHVIRTNLAAAHLRITYHLRSVLEHGGEVHSVVYSPNGKMLVTGSRTSPPRRWNALTGEPLGEPLPHSGEIRSISFSPDGRLLATAGTDKTARLWEADSGQPYGQPLTHKHWVHSVAFSPDAKLVVTGSADGTARLWDAATGEQRAMLLPPGWIQAVAFHPSGQHVATAAGNRVWYFETTAGKQVGEPMRHPGEVWSIAFSPDGKVLMTGSEEGAARLWEGDTGRALGFPLLDQGPVRTVGFSQDGRTIWTGGSFGTVRLWDAANITPASTPIQHQSAVYSVALSPDQSRLATGSADGTVRLWEKQSSVQPGLVLEHNRLAYCVALSPDGQTIATGSADSNVRLWNAATGQPVGNPLVHDASIFRIVFSRDGRTIATGSSDKTARLWNATDGSPRGKAMPHDDHVYAVALSPDGQTVFTGCKDSTARLWDATTGEPQGEPLRHPAWVHAVDISPDGRWLLTGCEDGKVRLWDAATRQLSGEPLEHRGPVRAVAFSPDGTRFISGTWDDGTARLWEVATRRPLGPPMPHHEHVLTVAFSPDGQTVATGTWDGTARLWDVATSKPLGSPLKHQRTIREVAFSPDGRTLWTASFDRTVRAWQMPPPVTGDVARVVLWIQVVTGMELDSDGLIRELDAATWNERRQQLSKLDAR